MAVVKGIIFHEIIHVFCLQSSREIRDDIPIINYDDNSDSCRIDFKKIHIRSNISAGNTAEIHFQ